MNEEQFISGHQGVVGGNKTEIIFAHTLAEVIESYTENC